MAAPGANQSAATNGTGCYATSRRPVINFAEISRMRARGLSVQNISMQLGCSMEDVRRALAPSPAVETANDDQPAWPLGECSAFIRDLVQGTAKRHGVDLKDVAAKGGHVASPAAIARAAMFALIREFCPELTLVEIGAIFGRDAASVSHAIKAHHDRIFSGAA